MLMAPSEPPKQLTLVTLNVAVMAVGWVTVAVLVAVHPPAAVSVTVYTPADKLMASSTVWPLGSDHLNVYPVPPLGVVLMVPLLPPKQETLVTLAMSMAQVTGGVIKTDPLFNAGTTGPAGSLATSRGKLGKLPIVTGVVTFCGPKTVKQMENSTVLSGSETPLTFGSNHCKRIWPEIVVLKLVARDSAKGLAPNWMD